MSRPNRIKRTGNAHYHVMSRTGGKRFLFKDPAFKAKMVALLERSAKFSGVRIEAYCIMDDHFHVVCEVEKPESPLSEHEVLERIEVLKGTTFAERLRSHWERLRVSDQQAVLDLELARWTRRMHDLSEFVKTYKELVNIAYKREHE